MIPSEKLKELREEIRNILDKGIEQFLLPYSNNKKPIYIYVQGYTPSFNDGDPCTHNSYSYNKYEILSEEFLEYEADFFGNVNKQVLEESIDPPDTVEFSDALESALEALEFQYGSDYQVLITLKDGNVSFVKDYYDCEY